MQLTGYAKGKLLLFGEHVVLYGYPAIGISVPLPLALSLKSTTTHQISFDAQIEKNLAPESTFHNWMHDLCTYVASHLLNSPGAHLSIRSTLSIGTGLGSSAALCVALSHLVHYGAVSVSNLTPVQQETIWSVAHRLEHFFHHTPSGIDTALATFGDLAGGTLRSSVRWSKKSTLLPSVSAIIKKLPTKKSPIDRSNLPLCLTPLRLNCVLLIFIIPRVHTSATYIRSIHAHKDNSLTLNKTLQSLGELSSEVFEFLCSSQANIHALAEYANQAHTYLRQLKLTHPMGDWLIHCAKTFGALGGKMSGAGGGGAHWAIFNTSSSLRRAMPGIKRSIYMRERKSRNHIPLQIYSGVISGCSWSSFRKEPLTVGRTLP